MVRKIIRVDQEHCTGCGECVQLCRQGALEVAGGKARLVADRLCDGLGVCANRCVQKALLLERREAVPFRGRFITDPQAARLAGGMTTVADPAYQPAIPAPSPSHPAATQPAERTYEPAEAADEPDPNDIFHYRLGLCCRATQCGRLCKRLVKQPGKAGVWCVDVEANTRTNLYQALAKPNFTCPDGVF